MGNEDFPCRVDSCQIEPEGKKVNQEMHYFFLKASPDPVLFFVPLRIPLSIYECQNGDIDED